MDAIYSSHTHTHTNTHTHAHARTRTKHIPWKAEMHPAEIFSVHHVFNILIAKEQRREGAKIHGSSINLSHYGF